MIAGIMGAYLVVAILAFVLLDARRAP